ncbi:MAG: trimeric intracellular cation channel family protein [Candidatus Nanopelagicaceae bacterium]
MSLLLALDFISTFAFAMVGARVAASKNMDYGGILFVASVTALSGGTFRNLVLLQRPAWLENSYLFMAIAIAVLITILAKTKGPIGKFILVLDSISLGVAVVAGVQISLENQIGIVGSVVIGLLSGVLGGLVRDVLCQIPPILLHRETVGLSALIGAFLFTILYQFNLNPTLIAIASGLVIVAIRLVSVKYRVNLPKVS